MLATMVLYLDATCFHLCWTSKKAFGKMQCTSDKYSCLLSSGIHIPDFVSVTHFAEIDKKIAR